MAAQTLDQFTEGAYRRPNPNEAQYRYFGLAQQSRLIPILPLLLQRAQKASLSGPVLSRMLTPSVEAFHTACSYATVATLRKYWLFLNNGFELLQSRGFIVKCLLYALWSPLPLESRDCHHSLASSRPWLTPDTRCRSCRDTARERQITDILLPLMPRNSITIGALLQVCSTNGNVFPAFLSHLSPEPRRDLVQLVID